MQANRSLPLAATLSLLVFASSTLLAASPAQAYPGGDGAANRKGFDTCAAPSTSQMQGVVEQHALRFRRHLYRRRGARLLAAEPDRQLAQLVALIGGTWFRHTLG
ncbi:MAG: hypothetical protein V7642_4752 [Burkholderiales bacterium]|jgi:hypothetical protein